jgi:polyisoprenoid-binding protein YceI
MAQKFTAEEKGSKIEFAIKNLGISVAGNFTGLTGNAIFDINKLENSELNFSVNSNSVNTQNVARDKHLRKEEYFDVDKFPKISFRSSKISATKRLNRYEVEGMITIKGISKPIKFELLASEKNNNLELKCTFEINRRNYKVGGNSLVLSDNVKMNIFIICNKE